MLRERPTRDEIAAVFSYDPASGHITKGGKRAGYVTKRGCRAVNLKARQVKEHHVAWVLMTGQWPLVTIDHKNLDPTDNRWENLREATKAQQCGNQPLRPTNNSGFRGVHWSKHAGKWRAQIRTAGRSQSLGYFDSVEAAAAAYDAAALSHCGEFYHPARSEQIEACT